MDKGQIISFEDLDDVIHIMLNVHGYDFRDYSKASLKRRVAYVLGKYGLTFFELKQQLVNSEPFFEQFLNEVTVNVTEMFRDPSFYASVRKNVLPYINSYPHIKAWNAGCSTGEETYSFAIMLKEEGVYDKTFLYGTDINS